MSGLVEDTGIGNGGADPLMMRSGMKSLIIGLPIVIAGVVALALAVGCIALADREPKASPSAHLERSKHPSL